MVQKESIRFLRLREGESIRAIARKTGMHRNTVKKALQDSEAPHDDRHAPIHHPVLGPFQAVIDAWLEEDKSQPPKQRHTAKRIYDRLCEAPYDFEGGETTVRDYVRKRREQTAEVYIPLEFGPGESAQCDWGEATLITGGVARKYQVFCMRMCYSGDFFVRLYPHQRQEAFFDGICRAFEFFGGVPKEVVFDNLKTAVKRILVGKGREEQEAFVRLRTHYVFESRLCNPASGNEKGMVENLVGYSRRNFLVPVPEVPDWAMVNDMLWEKCLANRGRRRDRRSETTGELVQVEQPKLLALPDTRFECCRTRWVGADTCSRIQETNRYSVPYSCAHQDLTLKAYVDRLEMYQLDRLVATHERSYRRQEDHLELDHYLEALRRKPGALRDAKPWRRASLPSCYGQLFDELKGSSGGCKDFIDVLLLRRDGDAKVVDHAVATAVSVGMGRVDAIRQLVHRAQETVRPNRQVAVAKHLAELSVPAADLAKFDDLKMSVGGRSA